MSSEPVELLCSSSLRDMPGAVMIRSGKAGQGLANDQTTLDSGNAGGSVIFWSAGLEGSVLVGRGLEAGLVDDNKIGIVPRPKQGGKRVRDAEHNLEYENIARAVLQFALAQVLRPVDSIVPVSCSLHH
jgi:hypothetical protein